MPETNPAAPPSRRVFATGATGSGKTTALRRLCIDRAPRALILDVTGEWALSADRKAWGYDSLLEALAELRRARSRRWRIAAGGIEGAELSELIELLAPAGAPARGLAAGWGGLALVLDEVDTLAPPGAPADVRALWQRGRHAGLSIYAATQRPHACHRVVTSQSQVIIVCQTHEPRDVQYLRALLPPDAFDAARQLAPHYCLVFDTARRAATLLDPAGRTVRTFEPGAPG